MFGVSDFFSNFRVYKKETIAHFSLRGEKPLAANYWLLLKSMVLKLAKYCMSPRLGAVTLGLAAKLKLT